MGSSCPPQTVGLASAPAPRLVLFAQLAHAASRIKIGNYGDCPWFLPATVMLRCKLDAIAIVHTLRSDHLLARGFGRDVACRAPGRPRSGVGRSCASQDGRSIQPWMGITTIQFPKFMSTLLMPWHHVGRSQQLQSPQEMFRGRIETASCDAVWGSACCTVALQQRQTRRCPLNWHAEAFASWPRTGQGGACSWLAKRKIVRQASEAPRFQRAIITLSPIILVSAPYTRRFYCAISPGTWSSIVGAQRSSPPCFGTVPGLTGPGLTTVCSVSSQEDDRHLCPSALRSTVGSWSTCLLVHLLNRAKLFIPITNWTRSRPRKFFLGL